MTRGGRRCDYMRCEEGWGGTDVCREEQMCAYMRDEGREEM
jgi:hypothetical protein